MAAFVVTVIDSSTIALPVFDMTVRGLVQRRDHLGGCRVGAVQPHP